MTHDWMSTTESLPPVGREVLVLLIADGIAVYAVASIEEDDVGEAYWDSSDDVVHGRPVDDPCYWSPLPHPPSLP